MCILIRIKSGVNSGQQALEKIQFEGTIAQKLEGHLAGGPLFDY